MNMTYLLPVSSTEQLWLRPSSELPRIWSDGRRRGTPLDVELPPSHTHSVPAGAPAAAAVYSNPSARKTGWQGEGEEGGNEWEYETEEHTEATYLHTELATAALSPAADLATESEVVSKLWAVRCRRREPSDPSMPLSRWPPVYWTAKYEARRATVSNGRPTCTQPSSLGAPIPCVAGSV
jgi:hypothetical protein